MALSLTKPPKNAFELSILICLLGYSSLNFYLCSRVEVISASAKESLSKRYSLEAIDCLNGHEFESVVVDIFRHYGFQATKTKGSGDQGADVILTKNGSRVAVQCKCYSGKVSNKAIQEVVGSLKIYNCETGVVVTNSYFTKSAAVLAASNGIFLMNRDELAVFINGRGIVRFLPKSRRPIAA